jgi:hypothetical protein
VAQVHDGEAETAARADDDQRGKDELGGEGADIFRIHGVDAGGPERTVRKL